MKKFPSKKEHKYKAEPMVVDGIKFPSTKEANYYCDLKLLKRAGVIKDFDRQVPFVLQPGYRQKDGKAIVAIKYYADFVLTYPDGHQKVVEIKGYKTDVYNLKKKMLFYKYPDIEFEEI